MTDFERLYTTYFADVYRYILRLSRDEHIAGEITSDTFFRAIKSIDSFRGDCEVRVWLCQIAKNCYYSYRKKRGMEESVDTAEIENLCDPTPDVGEQCEKKDEIERIQSVLHEIENPYKEVFMWRVYAELSFREIAQIFSKSDNWACVTYHRARKMIKERLEEKYGED